MKMDVRAEARRIHIQTAAEHVRALRKPGLTPQEARTHLDGLKTAMRYGWLKPKDIGMDSEEFDKLMKYVEAVRTRVWTS